MKLVCTQKFPTSAYVLLFVPNISLSKMFLKPRLEMAVPAETLYLAQITHPPHHILLYSHNISSASVPCNNDPH